MSISTCAQINRFALASTTGAAMVAAIAAIEMIYTASTIASIACAILVLTASAVTIASVTAWLDKGATDFNTYLHILETHIKRTLTKVYQFAAQTLVQAMVLGCAKGIETAVAFKMS